jgi:hypothetical protein
MSRADRSHLDVESPLFAGKPHAWIQWKGTDVCADIHCSCGYSSHFDGDFMYFIVCPGCLKVWEVGTHVTLYESDREIGDACVQEAEP